MIREEFKVELEPLTPTFVWSGETLYPNADYSLVGGRVIVIDVRKALGKVEKLEEAFREEFAREVQGKKLVFPSDTLPDRIMMVNEYLVPASSIKGLIRTAILNGLSNQEVYDRVRANLRELDSLDYKTATRNLRAVGQPVEMLLRRRVGNYVYDALSRLLISEPRANNVELSLKKVRVVEVIGDFEAEAYVIALTKGRLVYDCKVLQPTNYGVYSDLKGLDEKISKDFILRSLEAFSKVVIEKERKRVGRAKLTEYSEFLGSLRAEGNCVPIKVGMFAGHHAKTVALPPDVEATREKLMSRLTGHAWDSRTVKLVDGLGVGWVRLCVR